MATLYLMVGLPCSGKTTRAKALETSLQALRLTPDEWQLALFGQDVHDPQHDWRHQQIETMLWQIAARSLSIGTSIILDFGFWAREEREDFRARAHELGAGSEVIYLDTPEAELMHRLAVRNANQGGDTFYIPEEMLKTWIGWFQPPDIDELIPRSAARFPGENNTVKV